MAFAVIDHRSAQRHGFPERPRIGETVNYKGLTWVWYPPELGAGLSDDGMGFWGAIISAAIGTVGSLFGSKKKGVSEAEAQAAVDKARLEEQLAAAQQPRGAEAVFNKKTLPYWGLIIFGFLALR